MPTPGSTSKKTRTPAASRGINKDIQSTMSTSLIYPFSCLLGLGLLASCTVRVPQDAQAVDKLPSLSPDYEGVTIPYNIAPLNFCIGEEGDAFVTVARSPQGESLQAEGKNVQWELKQWKKLLEEAKGDTLFIDIYVQRDGQWFRYETVKNAVAQEAIDPYLSYRLIEPSYVFYENMSLNQRNLTNFEERVLFNNGRPVEEERGKCINCHAYQNYNREGNMQFHIRGYKGGTLLATGTSGKVKKIDMKCGANPSDGVYPAWHPSLPLIAYSTNQTRQHFHSKDLQKVEVLDVASGLILYDVERNEVRTICDAPDELETFPAWSPDGTYLYYASARYPEGVEAQKDSMFAHYREIRYDIYRRAFDADRHTFSAPDTVFRASALGRSATFPRISPDGKYLLFTLGDYGTFHIWHKSSDLYVMDLETRAVRPLTKANSADVDSYHSWSSNGAWIVFSSRRDDGSYTRPYLCYFKNGQESKAFILPQESPERYLSLFKSFNVPEFMVKPVDVSRKAWAEAAESPASKATYQSQ